MITSAELPHQFRNRGPGGTAARAAGPRRQQPVRPFGDVVYVVQSCLSLAIYHS